MTANSSDLDLRVLEARAHRLAAPLTTEDSSADTIALLFFKAVDARFATNLAYVDAVTRITDIFSIPHTPRHISGVIRRRGQTHALINLRKFFYPDTEGLVDEDFALVVRARNKTFAIQVAEIEGVAPMPRASLLPVPENFDRAQAPYISSVTIDGLAILNLDQLVLAEGFGTSRIEG